MVDRAEAACYGFCSGWRQAALADHEVAGVAAAGVGADLEVVRAVGEAGEVSGDLGAGAAEAEALPEAGSKE